MPDDEQSRSQTARAAAELALVRVVHHYGSKPEFVLLGGLVPALLCSNSGTPHAGTTDVDVQVDLEIAGGAVNTAKLEQALRNAEFEPDRSNIWRWRANADLKAVIKFELLADMDNQPTERIIVFDDCRELGAVNLRGTGYAARDIEVRSLTVWDQGVRRTVEVNVAGLAGFLAAKSAAARSRRKPKDWYDIAYVLLHNDYGDSSAAADRVLEVFGETVRSLRNAFADLRANFDGPGAQGTQSYVDQMALDRPELEAATAAADCQLAIAVFCEIVLGERGF